MTVLSMHHWKNRELGFREINQVATEKFVAITWAPNQICFGLQNITFQKSSKRTNAYFLICEN